jgi:hypothetical protein
VLDWLGWRLQLQWQTQAQAPGELSGPAPLAASAGQGGQRVLPDARALEALRRVVAMGYPRGILRQLDQIQAERPDTEPFIQRLRPLARAFQFEALDGLLRDALDELRSA